MVDLGAVSRMITNITNFKNFDDSFQECGLFYLKFVKWVLSLKCWEIGGRFQGMCSCVKKYNNPSYSGWIWIVFILAQVKLNLDTIGIRVSMLNDIDCIGKG